MKKLIILVYSAFLVIILTNFFYYRGLYNKQISYITSLLSRQVQIVGLAVDSANNYFISDLNKISYTENLVKFFSEPQHEDAAKENMKLFFSKYQDFVTGIKLYDNRQNEFTLKKDEDWLAQKFRTNIQGEIIHPERLVYANKKYEYYLPLIENNVPVGNIVVTIDYQKYFKELFSVYNLQGSQWQWVMNDEGEVIYTNSETDIVYSHLDRIAMGLESGSISSIMHKASIAGKQKEIISAYYSTQLITRNLGLIFSAPTDIFQRYLLRNSLFIVLGTLLLIQLIIIAFWRFVNRQRKESLRLGESEKMLFRLIEEMPVGVIIHNSHREIIKANKVAASQYSYPDEEEMKGKIFPETSIADITNYFSKNPGGTFNPDQFVIIKKEIGEMVLFRSSIPVVFSGESATMEMLIDVTMLESARKQEAKANVAKSEFLARMSYEIRTPLNGIIGMTDILAKQDVSGEVQEFVGLLRRSTEVLLNIINDILDFSKIETGKMILDEIPFNLREEIGYCTDLINARIADKNVTFKCNIDGRIPESIISDPFRLRQILTNLLLNSAANTGSGEIRLNCTLVNNDKGVITLGFELLDTGISFDKATLKKIFGDFVNIESKVMKNRDESGFGTILARQLVELMGGTLIAECPSGLSGELGSKVLFTIAAYSNDRVIKNLDHRKIVRNDQIKTLVISGPARDEEVLGQLHRTGLNISLTTFQRSTPGQIKAGLNDPEGRYNLIVITDDHEFNGFDAAQALFENELSDRLIIILMSSNDVQGNYLKCITMGIDHYFVKPYDDAELHSALKCSFPYIENDTETSDISNVRSEIRILVVEDNKMSQKVLATMLKTLGYSCDLANDGLEGFKMAKSNKYDLIFMDLVMPEMNGYDSARRILSIDKNVLIVAFTADNMPDAKSKAELSGIREFITKPVRIDELKRLLTHHFRKG